MTFFHLCIRQLDYGVPGEASGAVARHLADFLDILSPHALGKAGGGNWSLFGALGLSSSYVMSPRARFLALALFVFVRAQLLQGNGGGVRYKRYKESHSVNTGAGGRRGAWEAIAPGVRFSDMGREFHHVVHLLVLPHFCHIRACASSLVPRLRSPPCY